MSGYDQFFKEAQKARGKGKTIRRPTAPSKKTAKVETPEDRIRAELALRMQNKKRALKSKRAKFPVGAAITAVAVFAIGLVGYMRSDLIEDAMDNVFGHVEIGFFGSAEASAPKDDQKNQKKHAEAKPTASKEAAPAKTAEHAESANTEFVAHQPKSAAEEAKYFGKLSERKKELDLREAELAKLEEELHKRKQELDEKLKQLEAMRGEISKTLKTRVATDHEKVDKLVQVYSTMKPAQASKIIETLDEDLAVEILDNMKKKSAAEILNMMDAKKARKLSELLTGYERSPSSAARENESKE